MFLKLKVHFIYLGDHILHDNWLPIGTKRPATTRSLTHKCLPARLSFRKNTTCTLCIFFSGVCSLYQWKGNDEGGRKGLKSSLVWKTMVWGALAGSRGRSGKDGRTATHPDLFLVHILVIENIIVTSVMNIQLWGMSKPVETSCCKYKYVQIQKIHKCPNTKKSKPAATAETMWRATSVLQLQLFAEKKVFKDFRVKIQMSATKIRWLCLYIKTFLLYPQCIWGKSPM